MINPGRLGKRLLSWGALSWLVTAACGGITQRQGSNDENGGSDSNVIAGKASKAGSSSTSQAGAQPAAGSGTSLAGSSTGVPTPNPSGAPCFNDSDCPDNTCGGEVCNWTKSNPHPVGDKAFVCNPAGTEPTGKDGWCTTDADCKCRAMGARCVGVYCTFTRAADAPGG